MPAAELNKNSMRERDKKTHSFILGSCFLPMIAVIVLACVLGGGIVLSLPGRAAEMFGPPAAGISGLERYLLSAVLVLNLKDLTTPPNSSGEEVDFQVNLGESTASILQRLYQAGLITNPSAIRTYLQYSGLDTSLQAGHYKLSPAMSAIEIARVMQDATPAQVLFTILAGWRLEEIAQALPSSGLEISPKAFLSAAQMNHAGYSFLRDIPSGLPLEGFMTPGTYELSRDISAPDLVKTFLNRFNDQLTPEIQTGFSAQGLTIPHAVTLASIIQREAVHEEEMPIIASVFLNRLSVGMNLAADPTVQYAIGYNQSQQTWWTNPLSALDLQIDSPYNTYLYPGLPPTPIANPGLNALRSVAFPAQSSYYFFRATCDGSGYHQFSKTYEEHLQNQCR